MIKYRLLPVQQEIQVRHQYHYCFVKIGMKIYKKLCYVDLVLVWRVQAALLIYLIQKYWM